MPREGEYLETMLTALEERHGSTEAYLESELGAGAALRDKLCGALVEA